MPARAGGGSGALVLRGGGRDAAEHAQPPNKLPGPRRFSLRENEERGGHILQRHVGKTEEQLRQRLEDEPHLKTASSFRDEATAERAISTALERNQAAIEQWLKRPITALEILFKEETSLGIALDRGVSTARSSNIAQIVLKPDSGGRFYVLTSYLR
ncbi:MAG: hypothetical protein JNJ46_05515 [Myxococcales bacterium]|nr:hypothetical protein [Myxococcales bacterium]